MRLSAILLTVVLAGTLYGMQSPAMASSQDKEMTGKELRWQGTIVRINKKHSSLSVRGGQGNMESTERQIVYDSSTQWTKQGQPAEQSEFKEGSFVIVLGHADKKGIFHASRVDLRLPR